MLEGISWIGEARGKGAGKMNRKVIKLKERSVENGDQNGRKKKERKIEIRGDGCTAIKGAASPLISSAPKCSSRHFIFH